MLRKSILPMLRNEKGITGLETAIILIAFVVVASVFAYSVLSAGLFSSQKSKQAVHSGLEETRSTLQLNGSVIASKSGNYVDAISFTLANAMGGEPIDFTEPPDNVVVISYMDKYQRKDDLAWNSTFLGSSDGDELLEEDEKVQITIDGLNTSGNDNELTTPLGTDTSFTLEVKPPQGAVLEMERTTPRNLDAVMNLH